MSHLQSVSVILFSSYFSYIKSRLTKNKFRFFLFKSIKFFQNLHIIKCLSYLTFPQNKFKKVFLLKKNLLSVFTKNKIRNRNKNGVNDADNKLFIQRFNTFFE